MGVKGGEAIAVGDQHGISVRASTGDAGNGSGSGREYWRSRWGGHVNAGVAGGVPEDRVSSWPYPG